MSYEITLTNSGDEVVENAQVTTTIPEGVVLSVVLVVVPHSILSYTLCGVVGVVLGYAICCAIGDVICGVAWV